LLSGLPSPSRVTPTGSTAPVAAISRLERRLSSGGRLSPGRQDEILSGCCTLPDSQSLAESGGLALAGIARPHAASQGASGRSRGKSVEVIVFRRGALGGRGIRGSGWPAGAAAARRRASPGRIGAGGGSRGFAQIQLDRHAHFLGVRAHVAEIGVAGQCRQNQDDQKTTTTFRSRMKSPFRLEFILIAGLSPAARNIYGISGKITPSVTPVSNCGIWAGDAAKHRADRNDGGGKNRNRRRTFAPVAPSLLGYRCRDRARRRHDHPRNLSPATARNSFAPANQRCWAGCWPRGSVVSTGGGAWLRPKTGRASAQSGVSVWLDCDLETLWHRVRQRPTRPLLQTADPRGTLERLLNERRPVYALADIRVPPGAATASKKPRIA
jgi:hypothetical protein